MADPATPPAGGRKALPLLLIALIGLLLAYLIYRNSATKTPAPPVEEPGITPVFVEATPTARPATPVPTAPVTSACMPSPAEMPECKSWVVMVGPDASTLSADPICVGSANTVRWTAWDTLSPLKIYFPTSGFPAGTRYDVAPFADMRRDRDETSKKDEWVFQHPDRSTVNAGVPNPAFGVPGRSYCFKYDQEINGRRVDGRMIIQR